MKIDINKIKKIFEKYKITQFKNDKELSRWLKQLNKVQYNNLFKLTINPQEIDFDHNLLINLNLLNCEDYEYRILGMSKIKGGSEIPHLFERLCSPAFLSNKNYYLDLALLAKAKYLKYCLWLIEEKFLNYKDHTEDLSMVMKAKDEITAQVLAEVAMDIHSLKSKHHKKDLEIISNCDSSMLQPTAMYPQCSVNNLAINKVSLEDEYHLENMELLATKKISKEYLYLLMTDKTIINRKEYRREIYRLSKAKTKAKARAIYYFIANPDRTCTHDFFDGMIDQDTGIDYSLFDRSKCIRGVYNPRYNFYLKLLNEIDDRFVMYISYLLSNKYLLASGKLDSDIRFLLKTTNKEIFVDLFYLAQNKNSLESAYHEEDMLIISRIEETKKRKLLLKIATEQNNLLSVNHQYDMLFVSSLDLENFNEEELNKLYYYLFSSKGINHNEHISILENIYQNNELKRKLK